MRDPQSYVSLPKSKLGREQMTISVPGEIRERMQRYDLVWSHIAVDAFVDIMNQIDKSKKGGKK